MTNHSNTAGFIITRTENYFGRVTPVVTWTLCEANGRQLATFPTRREARETAEYIAQDAARKAAEQANVAAIEADRQVRAEAATPSSRKEQLVLDGLLVNLESAMSYDDAARFATRAGQDMDYARLQALYDSHCAKTATPTAAQMDTMPAGYNASLTNGTWYLYCTDTGRFLACFATYDAAVQGAREVMEHAAQAPAKADTATIEQLRAERDALIELAKKAIQEMYNAESSRPANWRDLACTRRAMDDFISNIKA